MNLSKSRKSDAFASACRDAAPSPRRGGRHALTAFQQAGRWGSGGHRPTIVGSQASDSGQVPEHVPGFGRRRPLRPAAAATARMKVGHVSKQVKQLDRVVIRFAGDSGDGMQLTGDRFTQESAVFGNDLVTLPNFPAEIRAPQGTLPGVSSFQVHFADHDILTAGDAPDVLVAMNPAALRANLGDLPKGRDDHRRHPRLHQAQPRQGRLRRQPARRAGRRGARSPARRLQRPPRRPDRDDRRGGQGVRPLPQGRRPREEHVRPRPAVVDVRAPHRVGTEAFLAKRFAKVPDIRDANITAFKTGWYYGETTEAFAVSVRDQARHDRPGHLPQHHRQPRAVVGRRRRRRAVRPAGLPRLLPDHPGLRHPPRAVASTRRSASPRSRPRTRSPASAPRSAPPSPAPSGSPPPPGPGSR